MALPGLAARLPYGLHEQEQAAHTRVLGGQPAAVRVHRQRAAAHPQPTAVWEAALAFWPPYAAHQKRISREIRLFRLTERR